MSKIIFLNLYSGAVDRGAESFAHELARQLEATHQVTFLKGNSQIISSHQFDGNLIARWFNRKRWFVDRAGLEILRFSWRQLPQILSQKPDWVVPMNGFWQVLLLKVIQPFVGFKILITGHSGPGWDERWNLYLKPTVFVASTQPTLEWARQTCSWTKTILIPYGIDTAKFRSPDLKSTVSGASKYLQKPIVLCPSALVEYKRVDLAIQAVANMKRGSLLVLGKGPLETNIRNLGQKLLGRDRFLLHAVSYDQMPAYYALAQVVTLPSTPQENSPMVFIEALAAGKPIVATKTPRVKWAIEDSGILIDPEDSDHYAMALVTAANSSYDTRGPLHKFLWENVLEQYQAILQS